jgi:hypothetical protein
MDDSCDLEGLIKKTLSVVLVDQPNGPDSVSVLTFLLALSGPILIYASTSGLTARRADYGPLQACANSRTVTVRHRSHAFEDVVDHRKRLQLEARMRARRATVDEVAAG